MSKGGDAATAGCATVLQGAPLPVRSGVITYNPTGRSSSYIYKYLEAHFAGHVTCRSSFGSTTGQKACLIARWIRISPRIVQGPKAKTKGVR